MKCTYRMAACVIAAVQWGTLWADSGEANHAPSGLFEEVPNFALLDHQGKFRELDYVLRSEGVKGLALFVQGNGCPLVRKRAPELERLKEAYGSQGIEFWMINANYQDEREDIAEEAAEYGFEGIPILVDESQLVAETLEIGRTAEMLLFGKDHRLIYRGAIDDRMSYQKERPEAEKHFFKDAVDAYLKGEPVARPVTKAPGCKISFPDKNEEAISYSEQIVPILKARCVTCHTKGGVGPFALSNYRKVKGWSEMMEERILSKEMPPWHADPHIGEFKNHAGLTVEEERTLVSWLRAGSPRGKGEDGLDGFEPEIKEWALGEPDHVITLPEQKVPAEGIIDYRYVHVDSPFEEGAWFKGMEVNPGNTQVVHHVVVTAFPKNAADDRERQRKSRWVTGYAPGTSANWFPEGSGVYLPQGYVLRFQLHYTASGREETDVTRLGFHLAEKKPEKEFEGIVFMDPRFDDIPPRDPEFCWEKGIKIPHDIMLYSMNPHMHFRGKWMRFDAHLPSGEVRPLLSVPNYNFNWQRTYRFAEPQRIPKGTKIVVSNAWDNSSANLHNPDPSVSVDWGEQSFDEMFFGTIYYVKAD